MQQQSCQHSLDLNPIERAWAILGGETRRRRASERVAAVSRKKRLYEGLGKITIEQITDIEKLLAIIYRCLSVSGGNSFHAC